MCLYSEAFPPLRRRIAAALRENVIRQAGQNFKILRQSLAFLPLHDLVAATKNFDLCALQAKSFDSRTA